LNPGLQLANAFGVIPTDPVKGFVITERVQRLFVIAGWRPRVVSRQPWAAIS